MFNYKNLCDYEFEILCKDILSGHLWSFCRMHFITLQVHLQ